MKLQVEYIANYILGSVNIGEADYDNCYVMAKKIELLTGQNVLSDHIVYIGYASQLNTCSIKAETPVLVVCIDDAKLLPEIENSSQIVIVKCSPKTTVPELFNALNRIVSIKPEVSDAVQGFLKKIASSDGFSSLMDSASKILGCSSAILTQGLKMLGYAELESEDNPAWKEVVRKRYYPCSNTYSLYRLTELCAYNPATQKFESDINYFPASGEAIFPLRSEDSKHELLGFLFLSYSDKDALLENIYTINFLSYALAFRMWRYINSPGKVNSSVCFLLKDIISGAVLEESEIEQKLADYHFSMQKDARIVVIQTSAIEKTKYSWEHLKTVFGHIWPDDILFTYSGDIVVMLSSSDESLDDNKLQQLTAELENQGCFAGISDSFSSIDRTFKNIYVRALAAAKISKLCNSKQRFAYYSDVALLHILSETTSVLNIRNICNPKVLQLLNYDKLHSSNYIATLQTYWHFNQNVQKTCEYLFIHRNTLFYRLKKIKELVGLDFSNPKYLVEYELSLAALTVMGDIPYNDFPLIDDSQIEE